MIKKKRTVVVLMILMIIKTMRTVMVLMIMMIIKTTRSGVGLGFRV